MWLVSTHCDTESESMLNESKKPPPSVLSTNVDAMSAADDVTPPEPVRDGAASATAASTTTKPVHCTSAHCHVQLRSERQLFDEPISCVPRRSPRPPRGSFNLADISEHLPNGARS